MSVHEIKRDLLADGTDVTREADRTLILRAVDATLATDHAIGRLASEVGDLAHQVRAMRRETTLRPPSVPEPRGELPSGIDLGEFARKVAAAAVDGERRPDTTPEEQVEKVVELVAAKREAAAIVKANDVRAKRAEKVLLGIVGAVIAAGIGHYLK